MLTKAEIGAKIRQLRLKTNMSQGGVGKALGKSHAAVSDIERGITDIAISDLYAIAHLFGVPVSEFLEGDNQKPPISFAQNRFAKDITPAEKKEAEQAIKDFDEQVLKEFLDKK